MKCDIGHIYKYDTKYLCKGNQYKYNKLRDIIYNII